MRRSAAALVVGALLLGGGLLAASGPSGTRPLLCAVPAGDVPGDVTVLDASDAPLHDAEVVQSVLQSASDSGDVECKPISDGEFGSLRELLGPEAHVDSDERTVPGGYYVRYGDAIYRVYESALV